MDQDAALLAEVLAARQPAQALQQCLDRLLAAGAAAAGARLFESVWHTLPPFEDERIAAAAAALYRAAGEADGQRLMSGLAAQLQLRQPIGPSGPAQDALAKQADAIAGAPAPAAAMLHALEYLERSKDWAGSAALFEAVWLRVPPMVEYWVYHRMALVYADLGRRLAAALMAGMAIQIEPGVAASDLPYRQVLHWLRLNSRLREAALLCRRRAALCAEPALLPPDEMAALLAQAGPLPEERPPEGRSDRTIVAADMRPPAKWREYGGQVRCLWQLREPMARGTIRIAELTDAEVLLDRGAVAVFGPDGAAHIDLSLRDYPAMVRRQLAVAERDSETVEALNIDAAVLIGDEFSNPNLCHFMLDQAPRLTLYRAAGVDVPAATVIGPELSAEYQVAVGGWLGIRSYVATTRRARLRVGRLWVSSTCRALQHPAHWGSAWAIEAVRSGFDLARREPERRLLISRADSPYRRIANEAEVAEVLSAFGFETIVPGRMRFADQIAAFRDAAYVVGPHGAGLANILFCAPGTHVLEVFPPLYGTWAYAMIAPALGLDYAAMLARDGESDDPIYNDPTLPQARRNQHAERNMRVDLDRLCQWLLETGA